MDNIIKLYKNDLQGALDSDDAPISSIYEVGFYKQLPNETFVQTTNLEEDIFFSGSVKAELVTPCDVLVLDVTDKFDFIGKIDDNGIKQITFEFGSVGINEYTNPLLLKLTDLVNQNVYYSNILNIADYNQKQTIRIDYKNGTDEYMQSVRIANGYFNDIDDEKQFSSYKTSEGLQVNYKETDSLFDVFAFDRMDIATYRRLSELFNSDVLFINGIGYTLKEFSKETRVGQTNWFTAKAVFNKTKARYNWSLQLSKLVVTNRYIPHLAVTTLANLNDQFSITFNKNINILPTSKVKLYKNSIFVHEVEPTTNANVLEIDFSGYTFTNDNYDVVVANGDVVGFNGYAIGEWSFTIKTGDFSNLHFNSNDFFTN